MRFNTKLLHGNFKGEEKTGATITPIFQSSAFRHQSAEELESIFKGTAPGYIYTRINNPTIDSFEKRMALLEKGIGAIACASGMSAISLAVLNLLQQGDELVATPGVFGGTFSLFSALSDYGIKCRFSKDVGTSSIAKEISEKTRLIFIETIGNPKMDIPDLKAVADLAHSSQVPLVADNTVATPYLVCPLELSADIVIHSTSKMINGSGNSIGGIIIDRGKFSWPTEKFPRLAKLKKTYGPLAYLAKLRYGLHRDVGACMAPFNAYLNSLGMETLGLRMERICANAMELALFLEGHPAVEWVNYPGLPGSLYHDLADKQFAGRFGGLLTFGLGTKEKAFKVINTLEYAYNLANIGDVRTLAIHPASTIYVNNTLEEKEAMGVKEDMIRISVGIEDIEDLKEDFHRALGQLGAS